MPFGKKREPFAPPLRTLYYGGASYEKSQLLPVLRQLAQPDPVSSADGAGGGPAMPPPPLGAVLPGGGPGPVLRGAGADQELTAYPQRLLAMQSKGAL